MGVHANSVLAYEHKPEYRRFVGRVGIDDQQVWHGTIKVKVFLGPRPLHESPLLRGGDLPWNIDVVLPPAGEAAGRVRLLVEGGGDGTDWDLTDWVDAGFITAG